MAEWWENLIDATGLYNTQYDKMNQKAKDAQKKYLDLVKNAQNKDLSYKGALAQEGLTMPDGKINKEKYFDTDTWKNAMSRATDATNATLANLNRNALAQSLQRGAGGNLANIINTASSANKATRDNAIALGNTQRSLRNEAGQMALDMGGKAQADAKEALNRALQMENAQYQEAQLDANAQERGLFQDPNKMLNAALSVASLIGGNPTSLAKDVIGGVGQFIGGLFGNNKGTTRGDVAKNAEIAQNNPFIGSFEPTGGIALNEQELRKLDNGWGVNQHVNAEASPTGTWAAKYKKNKSLWS